MDIFEFNISDIANIIGNGSPLSIIDSVTHPSYVIRKHGKPEVALEFSGMNVIQPSGRASIVTAPVEQGRYQAINKIYEPARISCQIVLTGLTGYSGALPNIFDLTLTSQNETLEIIVNMLKGTDLYDIETPKGNYESFDLTDYSYRISPTSGVSLLTVALTFQEVIQQMEVIIKNPQSDKRPIQDWRSASPYGTCAVESSGATKPSTLDELSKSWDSLKTSIGYDVTSLTSGVSGSFRSAIDTVKQAASSIPDSATEKATSLWSKIKGAVL